jgi:hypothetical protein
MHVRKLMLIATMSLALPAWGQVVRSQTSTATTSGGQAIATLAGAPSRARLPYTVEYSVTRVQTLANGTTITHESSETQALDSQGRRMTATTFERESEDHTPRTHFFVFDPVARTHTSWTVPGKRATVSAMPEAGAGHACPAREPDAGEVHSQPMRSHEKPVIEKLGTETIEGIEVRGERITHTIPVESQGNDAPLVRTDEVWSAIPAGLRGLTLRRIIDDPRYGKITREVKSLTQSDPDPALFQPPDGYEIVNQSPAETVCSSDEGMAPPQH